MKAIGYGLAYGGISLAVYALVGINAQPTFSSAALLGVGCVAALIGFFKIA